TQYLYRVGGDSVWSEWDYFTTAAAGTHDFSFLYFADAQHGLRTFYPRVIREAYKRNGGASFALFSGDLIDRPQYDSLWYEFFDAGDIVHRTLPSVMVPGNHEYGKKNSGGSKDERGSLTGAWRVHFRLPKNGVPGLEETSYSFVYQGVLFVMLNGNDQLSEQAAWLEKLLSKNRLAWTIVTVHQPLYSMSKERDQRKTRNAFLPVFDKYSVDLVLQGHDHVYARSKRLKNGIVSAEGTVYVTSDAGSDAYRLNLLYADLMEKYGTNVQLYQVIALHQRTLTFTAFMANGKVYDSFTLMKERK
ncbi:MAG: metallophosphoesterase family protein, partial [Bacteroidota bacterium]